MALLVSIPLQVQTSLCNWDESFPLLLGNEQTAKHPWRGRLSDVYIGDRALSEAEVADAFSASNPSAALGDSLLAFYHLTGRDTYRDATGRLPELMWIGIPTDGPQNAGIVLGPHQWLETVMPATALTHRLMQTSQFTLGATVAPHDTQQAGLARIISLSGKPPHRTYIRRNFTLGQQGRDLVFRLRPPLTGDNGVEPELRVRGVFAPMRTVHVVITYDGSHLRLYINGVRMPQALELTPGAAVINFFLPLDASRMRVYKILYYAMMFIPLGLLWSGTVTGLNQQSSLRMLIISVGIVFLPLLIESLLVGVSGRNISLENLLLSQTFMVASLVLFLIWDYKNNHLNLVVYVTVVLLVSIPLQLKTSLRTWDEMFPLLLGNERTADRPWRGQISDVYFADRALSKVEVADVFSAPDPSAVLGDALLAFYRLTGQDKYPDAMGHLPELVGSGAWQDEPQDRGVRLDSYQWLSTVTPATALTHRIRQTSQFTMGLTVSTHDTNQTGPARIVSLSGGPYRRNFTLGQQGRDLVFRLRTPLTGDNGTPPELRIPEVFATTKPANLALTYDGAHLLLYVNGVRITGGLELTPGAAAVGYLFPLDVSRMRAYNILYYAILFIPLGLLWSRSVTTLSRRVPIRMLVISGGLLLSSLLLESLLVGVSGRTMQWDNLLLSLLFMVAPLVLMQCLKYLSLSRKRC